MKIKVEMEEQKWLDLMNLLSDDLGDNEVAGELYQEIGRQVI